MATQAPVADTIRGTQIILTVAGTGLLLFTLGDMAIMEGRRHWLFMLVMLVAGYVLGRLWDMPANAAGLP